MAWSWSHTAEAYENVEANIRSKSREWLEVVFAEWRAAQGKHGTITDNFDERKYNRAMAYAKQPETTDEFLADFIWERTQDLATCTNGGFEAWCCPWGCHMVSFDLEDSAIEVL